MAAIPLKNPNKIKQLMPLFNRILIKKDDAPKQTKGGIVLPENSKTKVMKGTVIAIGPGARNENGQLIPMSVKIGDVVLLPEYNGIKVPPPHHTSNDNDAEQNQETYFMFRETELLAKFE